MSRPEPCAGELAAPRRWLSIVGIGEDGIAGLPSAARTIIAAADIVFGGKRHLQLAAPLISGSARPWPRPFEEAIADILAHRHCQVCVLASGDPLLYGVGCVLARRVPPEETTVVPAPSSFSLAAARLGWALAETALISLHWRPLALLQPHLQPGARLLATTSGSEAPAAIAGFLAERGFGASRLTVLEALGGSRERLRSTTAAHFAWGDVDPLNIVAIDVRAAAGARVLPLVPGMPDALFEHDGQLTKREIRAITLAALAPCRGELLWDVGAGAGSVAIEWMLADPSLQAIAIEARADRAARIRRNACACGVPALAVVEGEAPAALRGLPRPQAIFVGGGASDHGVLDAAVDALEGGRRLVVNAVTLQTEALLIARHAALGGELTRIGVARAAPIASKTSWRPALPVTQWTWVKP